MLCINTINTEENIMFSNVVIFFKYLFLKKQNKTNTPLQGFLISSYFLG